MIMSDCFSPNLEIIYISHAPRLRSLSSSPLQNNFFATVSLLRSKKNNQLQKVFFPIFSTKKSLFSRFKIVV